MAYDAQMALHAVLLTPVPPGTPVVNIGNASVTEGHTGTQTATFTVTLSSAASQALTLSYSTANGTATAGSDYQAASGTVTFAAGQATKTINVLVNGDRVGEPNETFFVNLGMASGSAVLGDAQGMGTIVDDEPRVGITSVTKYEGNSGTTQFVFTASLSAASTASVIVELRHGERIRRRAERLRRAVRHAHLRRRARRARRSPCSSTETGRESRRRSST